MEILVLPPEAAEVVFFSLSQNDTCGRDGGGRGGGGGRPVPAQRQLIKNPTHNAALVKRLNLCSADQL